MSDLIKKLRSIRESVYEQAGPRPWNDHDNLCADAADKAADRIEELQAENTRLKLAAQQPTARRTDIETSHEAAQDARFNATMNQLNVLLILHSAGPLTDFELADHSGVNQNSIGKRRLDCQRAGLVEAHIMDGEKVKRKSRPGSKSKAQVWRLTKAGTAYIKAWKQEQTG